MDNNPGQQLIRIGHSPDPDDAFMFYGLASGAVPSGRFRVEHQLVDIQTLNERARRGELEVTAISIAAYPSVADRYAMLACGCSMGDGYGPLVVARRPMTLDELRSANVAVPGRMTTAYMTFQLLLRSLGGREGTKGTVPFSANSSGKGDSPPAERETVVPFDRIIDAVAGGQVEAGLIIHEGQLTFGQRGLHKVVDLGVWWAEQTGLPLPLGGNVIRRDLGEPAITELAGLIRKSIQFGLEHRAEAVQHALKYARDMGADLADRFVGMYVNDWTLDYGERGRAAVNELLRQGHEAGLVGKAYPVTFV